MQFMDTQGHKFLALPDPYDAHNWDGHSPLRPRWSRLAKWLKDESSLKDDSAKALDLGEYVPGTTVVPQSNYGAGTCPACFVLYKLRPGGKEKLKVVLHGYNRPGYGYTVGSCPGTDFPPYEFSTEGTIAYKGRLERSQESEKRSLANMKSGKVTSFTQTDRYTKKETTHRKGEPEFERILEDRIFSTERTIKSLDDEIDFLGDKIRTWTRRPLPDAGTTRPDWGKGAAKGMEGEMRVAARYLRRCATETLTYDRNHGFVVLRDSQDDIQGLAHRLNQTVVRNPPDPGSTPWLRGAVKAYSFHWSNAQAAWDVITARQFPWSLDGAEFILFVGSGAVSLLGKPWGLSEMKYVARALDHHPGYAGSMEYGRH
jgi:hypothetical protein